MSELSLCAEWNILWAAHHACTATDAGVTSVCKHEKGFSALVLDYRSQDNSESNQANGIVEKFGTNLLECESWKGDDVESTLEYDRVDF